MSPASIVEIGLEILGAINDLLVPFVERIPEIVSGIIGIAFGPQAIAVAGNLVEPDALRAWKPALRRHIAALLKDQHRGFDARIGIEDASGQRDHTFEGMIEEQLATQLFMGTRRAKEHALWHNH